jgi:hypothetical protein
MPSGKVSLRELQDLVPGHVQGRGRNDKEDQSAENRWNLPGTDLPAGPHRKRARLDRRGAFTVVDLSVAASPPAVAPSPPAAAPPLPKPTAYVPPVFLCRAVNAPTGSRIVNMLDLDEFLREKSWVPGPSFGGGDAAPSPRQHALPAAW